MLETKNNKIMKRLMIVTVLTFGLFFVGEGQANAQKKSESKNSKKTTGKVATTTLAVGVKMNFAYIPAGEFEMGSNNGEDNEKPVHKVKISHGFWMQTTEVIQAQWKAVMKDIVLNCDEGNGLGNFNGDKMPVFCVAWKDAEKFVQKMNLKKDGHKYRLPTEAEWEYACRAGTTGDYAGTLDEVAWYWGTSGDQRLSGEYNYDKLVAVKGRTHLVGTKLPNAWGLYDMEGNVSEWCEDWFGDYPSEAVTDPKGPISGELRVLRGGGWGSRTENLRATDRNNSTINYRRSHIGFRVVRQ